MMDTKDKRFALRMKQEHLILLKEEAAVAGLSLSAWATRRLLKAARKARKKRKEETAS